MHEHDFNTMKMRRKCGERRAQNYFVISGDEVVPANGSDEELKDPYTGGNV